MIPDLPWEGPWEPLLGPWRVRGRRCQDERPSPLAGAWKGSPAVVTWAWRRGWHPVLLSQQDSWALQLNWYVAASGYVVANLHHKQRYLHRLVEWVRRDHPEASLGRVLARLEGFYLSNAFQVDHDDRSPLNNHRRNLKLVDVVLNNFNHQPVNDTLGVTWHASKERWIAKIKYEGRTIHVGAFRSPRQAGKAIERKRASLERDHRASISDRLAAATTPEPDLVPF